jgi:hypothetical protein
MIAPDIDLFSTRIRGINSRQAASSNKCTGNGLPAGLSQGYQAVEVSADRTSSHRLMHNGVLLRRLCVRNGGKNRNTKKNQQGELSEVHLISYSSDFSAESLFAAT